ncbi:hypothetical protein [Nitratireductor sp. StC3]|uniref:hypothetical protein n=1 Tax=Nitratireductor sp. StC3 TaxID=2126741 RepID=UPI000D0D0EC2|nr:hypothetical protein [Nitratireductor sp. StC3]PSM20218.1 hypothetical protein C7T96_04005 [Nitratireductor sp. StC3]
MTPKHASTPSRDSIRFPVQPRLLPPTKAARRLHLTLDEFRDKLPALLMHGFPHPCPVTGHFDLVAIDAFLDRRAGFAGGVRPEDHEAIMRERIARLG